MTPSIYIAVCASDLIYVDTVTDLLALFQYSPCSAFFFRGTQVPEQRQHAVQDFLKTSCTHLLFIDSDMRFPRDTAARLLSHNVSVVACDYRKRIPPHDPVTTYRPDSVFSGLLRVESVATGILLVHRSVFESLDQPWFCYPFDPKTNKTVTEDTYFCSLCSQKDIPLYVDCELSREVGHIASIVIRL